MKETIVPRKTSDLAQKELYYKDIAGKALQLCLKENLNFQEIETVAGYIVSFARKIPLSQSR